MRCGLLGETLSHSYSPKIHALLGDYSYALFEVAPENLEDFLRQGNFDGLNVTVPYKKAVIPYCAELSEQAKRIGSVNTLLRRADGSLYGDNTDFDGFSWLLQRNGGINHGEKALVLGSGGASLTVQAVLRQQGAQVVVISRTGENNYENIACHQDAVLLVNTTPVGMYPHNLQRLVDLDKLPKLRCVLDLVYNPARTALLLDGEQRGISCEGGLSMLVAQARRAAELFTVKKIPDGCNNEILCKLSKETENIIFIGMPGCGKSTVGRILAKKLGRAFYDADEEIVKLLGCSIPEFFTREGEAAFRKAETQVLAELGKKSGCVIATGGGCVTREENYPLLHQNGRIFWLKRALSELPAEGRPISQNSNMDELFASRAPLYARFADDEAENRGSAEDAAEKIARRLSIAEQGELR